MGSLQVMTKLGRGQPAGPLMLASAGLLATTYRLVSVVFFDSGGGGEHLRGELRRVDATIALLEVCCVVLSFVTSLSIVSALERRFRVSHPRLLLGLVGLSTSFLVKVVARAVSAPFAGNLLSDNQGLQYLAGRPFDAVSTLVEYAVLIALYDRVLDDTMALQVLCWSTILLIVAIHHTSAPGGET